jgi:N-acetylglutamate synthase-like GNAT family acetyltransferase
MHQKLRSINNNMETGQKASLEVAKFHNIISKCVFKNRAASKEHLDNVLIALRASEHHWAGERSHCYNLETLAVDPAYQNQCIGRHLVMGGLKKAADEQIATSVISADGKDTFYRKCGFNVEVGKLTDGVNNPIGQVRGGTVLFKDP